MSRATVTVRELKNKDTGIDITIPSHKEVKGLLHSSYEYQVVVVSILPYFKSPNHKDTDVVQFMVSRKFADFEQLHSQMSEKFSGTALPVLPKKVLLVSDQVAKERRTGLEIIMKFLASVPKLSTSSVLLEFLGVNAIKAGKFRKDQAESGALTSREQQSDTKSEIKEENGGGQGPPHSGLFEDEDNEENEDGVNFFSVDNTEEKGEDYHGKEDDAKLFDDQDFGVAFHKEEAYSVLLVPEANAVTKSEQAFTTEDNSELLQVDDDLDFLISNTLSLAEVKSKASVKEESKATGDHPSKETQRPAIKDKPKVITRSKPAISPKPMMENSTKTKPTIPTHPQSKEKYVHTKPAIKPRPAPKPKPEEDVITAGNNKNISKLDTSDILQYIDANTEEEDVDLFS